MSPLSKLLTLALLAVTVAALPLDEATIIREVLPRDADKLVVRHPTVSKRVFEHRSRLFYLINLIQRIIPTPCIRTLLRIRSAKV
jgi:hypothetical protein